MPLDPLGGLTVFSLLLCNRSVIVRFGRLALASRARPPIGRIVGLVSVVREELLAWGDGPDASEAFDAPEHGMAMEGVVDAIVLRRRRVIRFMPK